MKKYETHFDPLDSLLLLIGRAVGRRRSVYGRFLLDTGATSTTLTPEIVDELGYSAGDALKPVRVGTAKGSETGYLLEIAELDVLGVPMRDHLVHVFDLGYSDIDGLIGMNFLRRLNFEIRPAEHRILVEPIAAR